MAEQPTLIYLDAQTGLTHAWAKESPSSPALVDDEGHEIGGMPGGDFARYRLVGVEVPVGAVLLRHEDDGTTTEFALASMGEPEPSEEATRQPWRAAFRAADGEMLVLTETDLVQGLQEHPPVYGFA